MSTGISMFIHRRMKNECFFFLFIFNIVFLFHFNSLAFLHRICSGNNPKPGYESTVRVRYHLLPPVRRQPFRDIFLVDFPFRTVLLMFSSLVLVTRPSHWILRSLMKPTTEAILVSFHSFLLNISSEIGFCPTSFTPGR